MAQSPATRRRRTVPGGWGDDEEGLVWKRKMNLVSDNLPWGHGWERFCFLKCFGESPWGGSVEGRTGNGQDRRVCPRVLEAA